MASPAPGRSVTDEGRARARKPAHTLSGPTAPTIRLLLTPGPDSLLSNWLIFLSLKNHSCVLPAN